ncbi:TIGR03086 family metal-binding protein [Streptomyces thermocarboxydus]
MTDTRSTSDRRPGSSPAWPKGWPTRSWRTPPCPRYAVRHLLGHLLGLSVAFRDAGRKDLGATTDTAPQDALPDVGPAWRAELSKALDELAEAWRDPAAWTGMTRAGGIDMPGEVTAAVALDELVIHGWDLARATGQPYTPDPAALESAHAFLRAAAEEGDRGEGIFGPVPSRRTPRCWTGRSASAAATRAGPGPPERSEGAATHRAVRRSPTSFVRSIDETSGRSYGHPRRTSYVIYETRYARSDTRSDARSERRA